MSKRIGLILYYLVLAECDRLIEVILAPVREPAVLPDMPYSKAIMTAPAFLLLLLLLLLGLGLLLLFRPKAEGEPLLLLGL